MMQQFNDGEPLNIVNVNGKDYWIDRPCDFYEMLSDIGINEADANSYLSREYREELENVDGVTGDDYYIFVEQIDNAIQEVRDEIDNLNSTRREDNTKADIARRLALTMDNLYNFVH